MAWDERRRHVRAGVVSAAVFGFLFLVWAAVLREEGLTFGQSRRNAAARMPEGALAEIYAQHAADARSKLESGLREQCEDRSCAFTDVVVSLPLQAPLVLAAGDGMGQGKKAMLNPDVLFGHLKKKCVIYGLGISVDSGYEQDMSKYCETHGFDCTVAKDAEAVKDMPFSFHQTCIGPESTIRNTSGYGGQPWNLEFKPLRTVMSSLGHVQVDVLKFDIEGSEWNLLQQQIIDGGLGRYVPRQIQFELHTKWANPAYVPQDFVGDKGRREVNQLFLDLHEKGYRVISKEVNSGDPACAEFAVVLI